MAQNAVVSFQVQEHRRHNPWVASDRMQRAVNDSSLPVEGAQPRPLRITAANRLG
jgi:hypothetical protein